jgi:hypothetical protein
MKCHNPANHANHICQLKVQQNFEEVKRLKKGATHYCRNCEAGSVNSENLCDPAPYQGKVGILKWKGH